VIGGTLPRIGWTALVGLPARRRRIGVVIHRPGREPLERLTPLLEAGTVVPVIDGTYALEDARAAFERYGSGDFFGKIVLTHGA
jgi:NADPH:quinone reductase-like Zn-dependent oxidoreductase